MITGKNGIKMSKSKGNVVSPDDLVRDYGCDSLRMYELFVGPPELDSEWDDRGIEGVYRFLSRFWNLVLDNVDKIGLNPKFRDIFLNTLNETFKRKIYTSRIAYLLIINEISSNKCIKKYLAYMLTGAPS